ncbi:MAG: Uma2 family endonuclease [Cyanobacteria bacterium J06560_6]
MTYALTRYKTSQEYLDDESLSPEGNYRLLSAGELIEVASEDGFNLTIAARLLALIFQIQAGAFVDGACMGNKEIQVLPVGDERVNRKPDIMVIHPDNLELARQAIKFGMVPPLFVAEVVSPGNESSDNYLRDYVWTREQYQWWQIPEYWIIDPHREKITVLVLAEEGYKETIYTGDDVIRSVIFPELTVATKDLLKR